MFLNKNINIENIVNIVLIFIALAIDLTNPTGSGMMITLCMLSLILFHLFGGWRFFKISNDIKPIESLVYSIIIAIFELALLFKLMSWLNYNQLLIYALIITLMLVFYLLTKFKKSNGYKFLILKPLILFTIGLVFYFIDLSI